MNDAHREGGTSPTIAIGIGNAVDLQLRKLRDPGNQAIHQCMFMTMNRLESRDDGGAARRRIMWRQPPRLSVERSETIGNIRAAAELGNVIHASGNPGDALVVKRPPLPTKWNGVGE